MLHREARFKGYAMLSVAALVALIIGLVLNIGALAGPALLLLIFAAVCTVYAYVRLDGRP